MAKPKTAKAPKPPKPSKAAPKAPTSAKQIRANRLNAKKAGRPPKIRDRYLSHFKGVEPCPSDPLETGKWCADLLRRDLFATISGDFDAAMSSTIRNTVRAVAQLQDVEVMEEVRRLLRRDEGALDADAGPSTVAAKTGESDGQSKPNNSISG